MEYTVSVSLRSCVSAKNPQEAYKKIKRKFEGKYSIDGIEVYDEDGTEHCINCGEINDVLKNTEDSGEHACKVAK